MKSALPSFSHFNFSPEMTKSIQELGYENPTPIQIETLPILLGTPTDFLGLAATGTGKTAAFAIPLLEKMDGSKKGVQGLVLCPTRELAKQVSEQINLLARHKKTKALAIYGGSDYGGQLRALKEGVSIVVGTPGRIIDHLERKTLNLNALQTVILDEADEMISMGFKEEIEFILETVSQEEKHQTWLFSATMSKDIRKIADQFLHNPKQVSIAKPVGVQAPITQYYFDVHEDQKPQVVESLIDSVQDFHGLIFCQTKALVVDLTQSLKAHGYPADCLHGDMEQPARERAMKAFKSKAVTVMVCTDVAARGIDVKDLSHVINYSLPRELDNYVHRIGRTGRGGKEGIAWNLVNPSHRGLIPRIEKITQSRMIKAQVPKPETILKLKVTRSLGDFQQPVLDDESKGKMGVNFVKGILLETGWKEVLDLMSKEEIAARFLTKSLNVEAIRKSVHEEPRQQEGFTRGDRRKDFMGRTQGKGTSRGAFREERPFREKSSFRDKPAFGEKRDFKADRAPFADKKSVKGKVGGKSRVPTFASFAPKAAAAATAVSATSADGNSPWRRRSRFA